MYCLHRTEILSRHRIIGSRIPHTRKMNKAFHIVSSLLIISPSSLSFLQSVATTIAATTATMFLLPLLRHHVFAASTTAVQTLFSMFGLDDDSIYSSARCTCNETKRVRGETKAIPGANLTHLLAWQESAEHDRKTSSRGLCDGARARLGDDAVHRTHPLVHVCHETLGEEGIIYTRT